MVYPFPGGRGDGTDTAFGFCKTHGTSRCSNPDPAFRQVKAPTENELTKLTHTIASRVARYLERQGLLERDVGNIYLTPEAVEASDEDPSNQLLGNSVTYRIAVGPQKGRKVLTLQTLPDCGSENPFVSTVGEVTGFSLHAGVAARAKERAKLERLCRYVTRPPVSTKRLSLTRNGQVHYELKTPWRNGTTHVIFEPLDFISRLAALVPKPRVNLTRFHGVFAPNSKYRVQITPAKRGKVNKPGTPEDDRTPAERRVAMTWAQRLKRVFDIDITTCSECGGDVKIIPKALAPLTGQALASIEDPAVIQKILAHLDDSATSAASAVLPDCRASPTVGLQRWATSQHWLWKWVCCKSASPLPRPVLSLLSRRYMYLRMI